MSVNALEILTNCEAPRRKIYIYIYIGHKFLSCFIVHKSKGFTLSAVTLTLWHYCDMLRSCWQGVGPGFSILTDAWWEVFQVLLLFLFLITLCTPKSVPGRHLRQQKTSPRLDAFQPDMQHTFRLSTVWNDHFTGWTSTKFGWSAWLWIHRSSVPLKTVHLCPKIFP